MSIDTFDSLYSELNPDAKTQSKNYKSMLENVRLAMMFSVRARTLTTYNSGWNHWSKYTTSFHIDLFLRIPPSNWPSTSPYPFKSRQYHLLLLMLISN